MPMMFGFSKHRRQLLEAERDRIAAVARQFGALHLYVIGDLPDGTVGPASELELVVVQDTAEPFHRRADFWVGHVRPRVGTRFLVYTPDEFEELEQDDALLVHARSHGELLVG
jgi:hypothetical protein